MAISGIQSRHSFPFAVSCGSPCLLWDILLWVLANGTLSYEVVGYSVWLPGAAILNLVFLYGSLDPACGCLLVRVERNM